jgi:type II secretory ATPase GspE/PulE/Tfp pilus assembly ATPase PilB-like protein
MTNPPTDTPATRDPGGRLRDVLAALDPRRSDHAVAVVDAVLDRARAVGASDVHLQPTPEGLDGVLHTAATLPAALAPNLAARLKVLAELLTYRTDLPQEGRIRVASPDEPERRVSTFPTIHGERVVVRLFHAGGRLERPADLGLPGEVERALAAALRATSGAVVITGPSGSGKTTTLYASLRAIAEASEGRRSLVSIEDPVEARIPGVAQSQVHPASGFDLPRGLRSLVRQDPEVIALGEIRDPESAALALNAAMTGQLLLTTFHAGSAAEGLARLLEMGVEPYVLRGATRLVVHQRLARRLCGCARSLGSEADFLGLPVQKAWAAVGCEACQGSGYAGRMPIAEALDPHRGEVPGLVLDRADAHRIEAAAVAAGMTTRHTHAARAVESGLTSPTEVLRVLG